MNFAEKFSEPLERIKTSEGEIQLQRRGSDYEIIYNGVFIMSTCNGFSEKAAVDDALDILTAKKGDNLKDIKILLGGLGMGYSLRAALDFPYVSGVTVAECEPAVIGWNRSYLRHINNSAINDSRTEIYEGDFYNILMDYSQKTGTGSSKGFHLIMVDTDNGSTWLSRPGNANFYNQSGIKLIKKCLRYNGVVSFWCADREDDFASLLKKEFQNVSYHTVIERTGFEGCYYIAHN